MVNFWGTETTNIKTTNKKISNNNSINWGLTPVTFKKESTKNKKLSKWGDADLDGSPNFFDCDPRKVNKDGKTWDMVKRVATQAAQKVSQAVQSTYNKVDYAVGGGLPGGYTPKEIIVAEAKEVKKITPSIYSKKLPPTSNYAPPQSAQPSPPAPISPRPMLPKYGPVPINVISKGGMRIPTSPIYSTPTKPMPPRRPIPNVIYPTQKQPIQPQPIPSPVYPIQKFPIQPRPIPSYPIQKQPRLPRPIVDSEGRLIEDLPGSSSADRYAATNLAIEQVIRRDKRTPQQSIAIQYQNTQPQIQRIVRRDKRI